ncbi:MAG: alpha/beta hydrolase [Clostridiaceae bacterium]|nr:alpha/beta hydrolase [Clostridiaceae bacterium]MDY5889612.1 alpha/beta hydrolase [Oscillospiraceae bacterium]
MLVKTYNLTDDPDITLTAYIPDISEEMKNMKVKPSVLVLPGGAYKFCSDREAEPIALAYLAKGFNAFVLRYSLNEKSAFPTPLNDASKALKFIRDNAAEFYTDPQKIAVIGFSAGGHLAAALSTMSDDKPNACILGYPCILSSTSPILASPVESVTDYVTDKTPPTFIFAASNDGAVPIENSLSYAEALNRNGISFELHIFEDGDHGFSLGTDVVCASQEAQESCKPNAFWLDRSVQWLKKLFF